MSERTEVKIVNLLVTLKCRHQIDNYLDDPYVLECFGVVVSGKNNNEAVERLEEILKGMSA